MSTVVLGDIGGHKDVLDLVLRDIGVGADNRLSDDVTVVQVGDLVRAQPRYRETNTAIVQRVDDITRANPPGRWVQLIGNHENPPLGGPASPNWTVGDEVFTEECRSILHRWWANKTMVLAHSVAGRLITHAGLTREQWKRLGCPASARETADLLNRDCCNDLAAFAHPGRLVTGITTPSADCMWAEINHELLLPWVTSPDMPFTQIHGHGSPFRWPAETWWPDATESIRHRTVVRHDLRRTTTHLPDGSPYCLSSVDWVLEDAGANRTWPFYRIAG